MKNTTMTISFNTEKLDALTFHMGKRNADLQAELNDTVQKLYEKYVPQATREYIDDKVTREAPADRSVLRPTAGNRQSKAARFDIAVAGMPAARPCCPLFRPVSAFPGRGGVRVPLKRFLPCLAACERDGKRAGKAGREQRLPPTKILLGKTGGLTSKNASVNDGLQVAWQKTTRTEGSHEREC